MRPSLVLLACLLAWPCRLAAEDTVEYLRDVKPILKERCYACHGALKQRSRLRLDTAAHIRKGGTSGPAIEPGQVEKSLLIERVSARDETDRMPPEGKPLTDRQLALLREWVRQGAKAPADEQPEEDPRKHWAFQLPERPQVPQVRNAAWVRNPIDAFIAAEHEKRGLSAAAPAAKAVLLRRVYLDLIGLPPTREERRAFLADPAPDAYERVVDRLLASPRHAERWGRHWMDIWRYSDWYGSRHINELRYSRRHIWRWRDWIIESLEKDKGYDRMLVEMLAGDELAPADTDVRRASGYLGRNFYVFNRHVWLQDTVEYTGTAILGLTLKCCRCHDHKYDPLAQEDYYRFRAFFEPHHVRTDPIPGQRELIKGNVAAGSPPGARLKEGHDCVYDANPDAVTYLFERGNEKNPVKDRAIPPGVPSFLAVGDLQIEPVALPLEVFYPDLRPAMREETLAEAKAAAAKTRKELSKAKAALAAWERKADAGPQPSGSSDGAQLEKALRLAEKQVQAAQACLVSLEARIAAELARYVRPADADRDQLALAAAKAEQAAALYQAELEVLQAEAQLATAKGALKPKDEKSAKAVADAEKKLADLRVKLASAQKANGEATTNYPPVGPVYPQTSSGRRLALARWIASKDNPLTARVAVNHVWLRHIGSALVPSVSNFGRNGQRPTHPELLDWLAVELMERNWSLKALHRLIVTSNTYRMDSSHPVRYDPHRAADPENRYLWRANLRRMEAEVVRDSLLHLAGRLDVTRGGEDLDPATDHVSTRRSLYFRHTPDEKPVMLEVFDAANPSECFERSESIVPQQALALANSDFCHSQARLIARHLARPDADGGAPADVEFITAAFEQVLARPPAAEERARCEAFLKQHAALLADVKLLTPLANPAGPSAVAPSSDPRQRARENLVHVLLNYNDFVTIR
jgi:hypothetical protein